MPIHLEPLDVSADLEKFNSVLIVSCPVCPPVSLALQENSPLLEFFKRGVKTKAFEDYVGALRASFEQRGARTGVLTLYTPLPTMCLWTEGQRRRLLRRARNYEAVLVLGCDSATHTAKETLQGTECQVLQAMRMTGISNATVRFRPPLNVVLERGTEVEQDAYCGNATAEPRPASR